jgi:hypothetical protein
MITALEKTILDIATQKLDELKAIVAIPSDDEEQLRSNVSYIFTQIITLTDLAQIEESGMSKAAAEKLITIHNEVTKLSRTFSWMYNS